MRTTLGIIACILALPALATVAIFIAEYDTPLVMGRLAVTALTVCAFINAGEQKRYLRVFGWIAIAVAASLVYVAIDADTDSTDRLPAPVMSILLPLGAGMLCGRLRRKLRS